MTIELMTKALEDQGCCGKPVQLAQDAFKAAQGDLRLAADILAASFPTTADRLRELAKGSAPAKSEKVEAKAEAAPAPKKRGRPRKEAADVGTSVEASAPSTSGEAAE